jgi:hypothetical protein
MTEACPTQNNSLTNTQSRLNPHMNISEGRTENNSYIQLNHQKHDGISTNKYAKLLRQ